MPVKADWISFVMHFVLGLIVGCACGFGVISRRGHGIWLQEEWVLPFLCGAALLGAGLGAKWGDRLWLASGYRVIPPDAPKHSRVSRYVSTCSMFGGGALAVISFCRHFF